ncbi:MAG TPA: hypothetical protein VF841_21340 [Anaeromyxobacter sp.]
MRISVFAAALAIACSGSGSPSGTTALAAPPCAGIACGVPEPPVTLHVVDAITSAGVEGVVLTNVTAPPSPPGSGGLVYGCNYDAHVTICTVDAIASGTYELDVTAPGYATVHLKVEVPPWVHVPGACCEPDWVSQTVGVRLTPAA